MSVPQYPHGGSTPPRPNPRDMGQASGADASRPPGIFDIPWEGQPDYSQADMNDRGFPSGIPPQNEWGPPGNAGGYAHKEDDAFAHDPEVYPQNGQMPPPADPQDTDPAKRKLRILVIVLIIAFVLWLLVFQVFVIRRVNVSGTTAEIWKTVANAAGLDHSPFFFFVNENKVREGVESNRYLIFESMQKIIPGTVNIKVIQRRPYAFFTHLGVGYVLSKDGMILEKTRELRDGENLMKVIGLALPDHQSPGTLPASNNPSQTETMLELFNELAVWQLAKDIDSIDIAESLNLTLLTIDGYTINLGDENSLHAKVGTVAAVVSELRRRHMTGGIIEATRPGEATYRAEQ